jgi:acylphosphatase
MPIHLNIVIKGKVQGVFFRDYTSRKANELGIKGFVKNRIDGSVYIEAEGDKKILEGFISWCHQGSPRSHVEQVESEPAALVHFSSFKIEK